MKVLLTGGTGFIGSYLTRALLNRGDEVVIVSRRRRADAGNRVTQVVWDDDLAEVVSTCDAVVNLAGSNLFDQRWSERVRKKILKSRIDATSTIVNAIRNASKKPNVLISGSATGYYGTRGSDILTEEQPSGQDFLAKVCVAWETEAKKLDDPEVRLVIARIGIVKQKDDGALQKMLLPFKLYGGGPLGNGTQYYPWIHMDDLVGGILFAIDNPTVEGPVNLTAPNPVTMDEFARILGEVMSRPSWFRVPSFALKLAVGDAAEAITASMRAVPDKLIKAGYTFRHPDLKQALKSILAE